MSKEVASVYLHIGNSGVTIGVIDEGWGPTIEISSSSFGNNNTNQKVHVHPEDLKVLSRMFEIASEKKYSQSYCHAARTSKAKPPWSYEDVWTEPQSGCCSGGSVSEASSGVFRGGFPPAGDEPVKVDNLSFFYTQNFVSGEVHQFDGDVHNFTFQLRYKGFLPKSLVVYVEKDGQVIQRLIETPDGALKGEVYDKRNPLHSLGGGVGLDGSAYLIWNSAPGPVTLKLSYEYDAEIHATWKENNDRNQ